MKRLKAIAAAMLSAAVLAGCGAPSPGAEHASSHAVTGLPETEESAVSGYIPHSKLIDCLYYDDTDFHVSTNRSTVYETEGSVLCGVAPHHLAAGHFIAGMYRTVAETRDDIETVVLIAPMHYEEAYTLCTSRKSWQTAFGITETDTEITELFRSELGAEESDYMTGFDHSASSHIPFIRYYLPDAKVACLLVSPREKDDLPERLSALLYKISQQKSCLFAFSIDFSHYLDPDEADIHDAQTLEAVMSGSTVIIEQFTNSNVDTPYCLSTYVRLSELLGGTVHAADNANTFTVSTTPYSRTLFPDGVTSYFVFLTDER